MEVMCIPSMHWTIPDEFQVVAVAEPDKERRELLCGKDINIPAEMCFESYEELAWKRIKLADCAMVCTHG